MAQGTSALGQGLGSITSMAGDWEPSIWFMFFLVIAELAAVHILTRILK